MAKEPTTTRLPLSGLSRIPIPGSSGLRPPSTSSSIRPTQILRPPTAGLATKTRPSTFAALRPSAPLQNPIKKSSSGDRINHAVNLMGKKTTSALKKFFGKADKSPNEPTSVKKQNTEKFSLKAPSLLSTKQEVVSNIPLTRSDTFVRSDNENNEVSGMLEDIDATPVPMKRVMSQDASHLQSNNKARTLFYNKPKSFDTPIPIPNSSGQSLAMSSRTQILEKKTTNRFGGTAGSERVAKNLTYDKIQSTPNVTKANLTQTLNGTHVLGQTACLISPKTFVQESFDDKTMVLKSANLTKTLEGTQFIDRLVPNDLTQTFHKANTQPKTNSNSHTNSNLDLNLELDLDLASPATNATFSNPGSSDNLLMLEDISAPSGLEPGELMQLNSLEDQMDSTLMVLAPDKANMKLPLNSTMNTERLVDISGINASPAKHIQLLNLTKDYMDTPRNKSVKNTSHLLYMTQLANTMTPDRNSYGSKYRHQEDYRPHYHHQHTPMPQTAAPSLTSSPRLLKGAQSDLVLPIRTPDEEMLYEPMDVDTTLTAMGARTEQFFAQTQDKVNNDCAQSLQDLNDLHSSQQSQPKTRFSFGLDLTESTLDCSIELIDVSLSSTVLSQPNNSFLQTSGSGMSQSQSQQHLQQQQQQHQQQQLQSSLKKQNSFDMDESLGILTPDQMKEFLDSTTTNNTNNLDLPLQTSHANNSNHKHCLQQMRADQTPSPEELPLDPVEVRTDISDMVSLHQQQQLLHQQHQHQQQHHQQQMLANQTYAITNLSDAKELTEEDLETQDHHPSHLQSTISIEPVSAATDTELSKTDHMSISKSTVSKISTSFITSVTSVTSLDTGYQGDGEMSRPASRGASDHSPSNSPNARKGVSRQPSFNQNQHHLHNLPPVRRQDPMADSDFFTESDADDIFHNRGDRRAQVIDGHLYGPALQSAASVFISEDPQMEDSCMESSGIFTDIENRGDEDPVEMRRRDLSETMDLSPEGDDSAKTVKSNAGEFFATSPQHHDKLNSPTFCGANFGLTHQINNPNSLPQSTTNSTIHSSFSNERLSTATLSNRTSYCSVDGNSVVVDCKSFASLEEAFGHDEDSNATADQTTTIQTETNMDTTTIATKTTTITNNESSRSLKRPKSSAIETTSKQKHIDSVQILSSPRKHASLNSLPLINKQNFNNNNNNNNNNKNNNNNNSNNNTNNNIYKNNKKTATSNGFCGNIDSNVDDHDDINDVSTISTTTTATTTTATTTRTPTAATTTRTKSVNSSPQLSRNASKQTVNTSAISGGTININSNSVSIKAYSSSSPTTPISSSCDSVIKTKSVYDSPKSQSGKIELNSKISTTPLTSTTSPSSPSCLNQVNQVNQVNRLKSSTATPNKWDAVMNKIAESKATLAKKNYNEVKSKISSNRLQTLQNVQNSKMLKDSNLQSPIKGSMKSIGSVSTPKRVPLASVNKNNDSNLSSPSPSSSPRPLSSTKASQLRQLSINRTFNTKDPLEAGLMNGMSQNHSKRTSLSATRRGRSYSKDSQKSSQSDLSHTSGSPKLLAKTPTRAAKKRDVRNLSISPTDLGPPPKTQQTSNGTSNRTKPSTLQINQNRTTSATFVRASSLTPSMISTSTNSSSPGSIRIKETVPINKKSTLSNKRFELKSSTPSIKPPLKESNRVINSNVSISSKTSNKSEALTELEEISGVINYNNNNNLSPAEKGLVNVAPSEQTSPCLPIDELSSPLKSTKSKDNVPQKLQSSKSSTSRKIFSPKQKSSTQLSTVQNEVLATTTSMPTPGLSATTMDYINEIDKHFVIGNSETSVVTQIQTEDKCVQAATLVQTKDIEALGVLIQYLVYELDAFACPELKVENSKTKDSLQKTLQLLDEARNACTELQDQLSDKEAFFRQREQELQSLHRCELEKAQATILQYEQLAGKQASDFEKQILDLETKHQMDFEKFKQSLEEKYSRKLQKLMEAEDREKKLQERIQELECSELKLHEQLTQTEIICANRIQSMTETENNLEEHVKILTRELEIMKFEKEQLEKEHKDKLEEMATLRSSRKSLDRNKSPKHSLPLSTPMNTSAIQNPQQAEITRLENEIKSLQYVLEMKQSEINKLKKTTDQLVQEQEDRTALQCRAATLESKLELLHSEMALKTEKEKALLLQIEDLQKTLGHETTKRIRVSYDNEALQWQLKQRSEQLHLVEMKLQESLNSSHNSNNSSNTTQKSNFFNDSFVAANGVTMMDDVSQPTSPVVKGFIEKNDSVSWILEMDDETPETAARRVVMRAGSFRGNERPSSARYPSPLAQSMSATNVDAKHMENGTPHMRFRSKSVSQDGSLADLNEVKVCLNRRLSTVRQGKRKSLTINVMNCTPNEGAPETASSNPEKHDASFLNTWVDHLPSSSPCPSQSKLRPRSSTLKANSPDFLKATNNSSNLSNSSSSSKQKLLPEGFILSGNGGKGVGESLDLLPGGSKVKSLKGLKIQQIQESAGEAMVSGANSEDESCSACSDEITKSSTSGGGSGAGSSSREPISAVKVLKNVVGDKLESNTNSSGTYSGSNQAEQVARLMIDEVLLFEEIENSLPATPMDVSWSEDNDDNILGSNGGSIA